MSAYLHQQIFTDGKFISHLIGDSRLPRLGYEILVILWRIYFLC